MATKADRTKARQMENASGESLGGLLPSNRLEPIKRTDGLKVRIHRPRRSHGLQKDDRRIVQDCIDIDGFVSFSITPRFYNLAENRFDAVRGNTIGGRAFSIEDLEKLIERIERVVRGEE